MTSLYALAQGAKSILLTEVMTDNRTSVVDEYGKHKPWVELSNSSFTTYNIRNMFLTTDRRVLDPKMTPEQRRSLMAVIPNNEAKTLLAGKKSILIFDTSWSDKTENGTLLLNLNIKPGKPTWIALYDGNAVTLIDSVSIPALASDQTYARSKDFKTWAKANGKETTPGYLPTSGKLSKSQIIKQTDPHGFGITVLAMGIVFSCLALLYIFFSIFGGYMKHKQRIANATKTHAALLYRTGKKTVEITSEISRKTNVLLKDGLETKGIDKESYMAVIALAMKEYLEDVHDIEPGIITIKPKQTRWNQSQFNNN